MNENMFDVPKDASNKQKEIDWIKKVISSF